MNVADVFRVDTVLSGTPSVVVDGVRALLQDTVFRVRDDAAGRSGTADLHVVVEAALGPAEARREIERLRGIGRSGCILLLAQREDVSWAKRAGADACLPQTLAFAEFVERLEAVVAGRRAARDCRVVRLRPCRPKTSSDATSLDERELAMCRLVGRGLTAHAIVRELGLDARSTAEIMARTLRKIEQADDVAALLGDVSESPLALRVADNVVLGHFVHRSRAGK